MESTDSTTSTTSPMARLRLINQRLAAFNRMMYAGIPTVAAAAVRRVLPGGER